MLHTMEEIKAAAANGSPHWFSKDAMRFFRTRLSEKVHPAPSGAYFVTSEQREDDTPRLYSVRYCSDDGQVTTVGEFQGFETSADAHTRAANYVTLVKVKNVDPTAPFED